MPLLLIRSPFDQLHVDAFQLLCRPQLNPKIRISSVQDSSESQKKRLTFTTLYLHETLF